MSRRKAVPGHFPPPGAGASAAPAPYPEAGLRETTWTAI
ncbi:hypothetical protein D516_3692 [Rhodobacter sp. AKP1]|nr:hypothetical protein D516_3692 [Rhodobacter sp. AKP1]